MKLGSVNHPKIKMLMNKLNIPHYAAVGLIECLHLSVVQYAPGGRDIGKWSDRMIAHSAGWEGPPEVLVGALLESEFIEFQDSEEAIYRLIADFDFFDDNELERLRALEAEYLSFIES